MMLDQQDQHEIAARLRTLDVLDRITQISLVSKDTHTVLNDVLDLVLDLFHADRAWFLYPCDPDADTFSVPFERSKPDWQGPTASTSNIKITPVIAELFTKLLDSESVTQYQPDVDLLAPLATADPFSIKSQLQIAMKPKSGAAWVLGIHHCSADVIHPEQDLQLFNAIARRVSEMLDGLILFSQLNSTQGQLEATLNAIPDVLFEWDIDGRIHSYKTAQHDLLALESEQILGKELSDVMPAEAASSCLDATQEANIDGLSSGKQYAQQVNNKEKWFELSVARKKLDDSNKPSFVALIRDITERKRTEESLRRSSKSLAEAQRIGKIGSWELDLVNNELRWSDQIFTIFEVDKNNFTPSYQLFLARVHPEDREAVDRAYSQSLRTREPYSITHRLCMADGRIKYVHEACETHFNTQQRATRSVGIVQDITERKAAETALLESEKRFRDIANVSADWIWELDSEGRYSFASESVTAMLGFSLSQIIGRTPFDFMPSQESVRVQQEFTAISERGAPFRDLEHIVVDSEGAWHYTLTSGTPIHDTSGQIVGYRGINRDVTDKKHAEARLQLAANVFSHAHEGIFITDAVGTILEVNETFTQITGYPREEVMGRNPRFLKSGRQSQEQYDAMWLTLKKKGYWYGELWNKRKNGENYAEMLSISTVYDDSGAVQNYVALFSDITSLKMHQQQLEHIAHYDPLTNLPNRVLLADRLHQAMIQSQRHDRSLAVAFLDLDGFKSINDSYGHSAGDELLILVAERMKEALREGDTLARIGGDEFVAVLVDVGGAQDYEPVLHRLLQAAANPFVVGDALLQVSTSIGVTLYPQDEVSADQLMRHADQAMYTAKQRGKNNYHLFDVNLDAAVKTRHESLERIQQALEQHEFVLYFQPKVNMKSGEVISLEALIRWQHPVRGLLLPEEFLPVVESHAISVSLDEWVIDSALSQINQWQKKGLDLPVSVNVGADLLQQADFVNRLSNLLGVYPDVNPALLELEILETNILEDVTRVSERMHACIRLGVNFSLDDFGTGYSSLTYLKRLPAKVLKIDRSFIRDMLDDSDDLAIVEGIIGLANAFHRKVVAEGVETIAHGTKLLPLGCELAQGYSIAKPMPAAELPEWISSWRPDIAWAV